MGICESSNNTTDNNKPTENIMTSEQTKINQPLPMMQTNMRIDRIQENIIDKIRGFDDKETIKDSNVSKAVCKIKLEAIMDNGVANKIGSGFLLKFYVDQEIFYCLVSNRHILSKDKINNNMIYIFYDNELKGANIELDKNKRYIKSFKDLDITIVEIKEEDKISKDCFLFPEDEYKINNKLINNNIYIPQYPEGKELKNAKGIIKAINKYEITHLANTKYGSSGSPILLENRNRVIGIHKEGKIDNTENYGDFIYPAINIIKNEIKEIRNKGKYINGKYIYNDGKYYIGQFKNNLMHGKGIDYYSNGNILYEGDFVNDKYEGYGKYIWENGEYYIGQEKNGLSHGKGIDYYSNGKIKYEGDFVNDKYEGYGKYIKIYL